MGPSIVKYLKDLAAQQAHLEATSRLSATNAHLAVHDQTALQEHEKWLAAGKYRRWCRALSCALQTWNAHIIAVGRLRARRLDECRIIAREDAMTSLDFTGHYRGE